MAEETDNKFLYTADTPKKFLYVDLGEGVKRFLFSGPSVILPDYPTGITVGCDPMNKSEAGWGFVYSTSGTQVRRYDLAQIDWTLTPQGTGGQFYTTYTNGATFCANPRSGSSVMMACWGTGSGHYGPALVSTIFNPNSLTVQGEGVGFSCYECIIHPRAGQTGNLYEPTGYAYWTPVIPSRDMSDPVTTPGGDPNATCVRYGVNVYGSVNALTVDNSAVYHAPYDEPIWDMGLFLPMATYQGFDGVNHRWDAAVYYLSNTLKTNNFFPYTQRVDYYQLMWVKLDIIGTANGFTVTDDPGTGAGTFYDMKEPYYSGQSFMCGGVTSGPDTSACGDCPGESEADCEALAPEDPETGDWGPYYECYDCWWMCQDTAYVVTPPLVTMTVSRLQPEIPLFS